MPTDASTHLSTNFTLGDLTTTSQALSSPNLPYTADDMANLSILADVLEQIKATIGNFNILSAYRTRELQEKLAAIGEPVSPTKSFHEVGRGADLGPTDSDLTSFFGRIVASPVLLPLLSEISIKPSQGAIHLAVNVPGDMRDPKVLILDDTGTYVRMTDDALASYIQPFLPPDEVAADVASTINSKGSMSPMLMIGLGLAAALLLFGGAATRKTA